MENCETVIYTSSHIINKGIFVILKELNFDISITIAKNIIEFEKIANNSKINFLIADAESLNCIKTQNIHNKISSCDIILIGSKQENNSGFFEITNNIELSQKSKDIFDLLNSIFNNRAEPVEINEISKREQEIIKLVAKGLTNKEIAEKLFLSVHTVITHRKNISNKLGIKTISGLTIYAIIKGIIDIEEK